MANTNSVSNTNNNNPSGGGRFDFDDGGTYCGGWEDGKAHGHGICTGPKGQGEYSGAWHYGYEVSGVYTWPSGNTYEGQWQNGKRHGLGVELRGRWIYKGEWTNGCKGRYGTKNSVNSQSKYEGTWAGGLQDGYGIETYADGGIYQGQWLRGMRHGYGIRKSAPYSVAAKYRSRSHAYASLTSLRSDQGDDSADKDKRTDDNKGGFVLRARSEPPSRRRSLSEKSMAFRRTIWQGFRIKKQRSTGDIDNRVATGSIKSSGSTGSCASDESGATRHSGGAGSAGGVEEFVDPNAVETYAGEWKNDRRSGFGVSERSDGLKYEGEWFNNKKYGYGLTTFKDGRREEGKYKNNVLLTSQRCRNMIFIRASKLKERVEAAVQSAVRASTIAVQKAEIASARATTSVDRCSQASVASQQAREDCEIARLTASSFAPDFFQPGLARRPLLDLVGNHVDARISGVTAASLISAGGTDSPADLSAAIAPQEPQTTALPPVSSSSFPQEPPPSSSSNFQSPNIPTSSSVQTKSNPPPPPAPPASAHHHTVGFVDVTPTGATSRTLPPTMVEEPRQQQPPPSLRPSTSLRDERTTNGQAPAAFFPPPLAPAIPPYFQMAPNAFYPAAYPFTAPAPYNKSLNDELMYAMHLASQKMYLQQMTAYYQQQQQQMQQQQMRFRMRPPQQSMQQASFGDSSEQFYSASESLNGSRRQSSDESLRSPFKKNNSNLLRYPQVGPSTDRLDSKQDQRRQPAPRSQRGGGESPGLGGSRISLNKIVYDYFDQYNNNASGSQAAAFAAAPGLAQSRAERYRRRMAGGNRGQAAVNFSNLNSPRDYVDYSGSSTEEMTAPGARRSTLATPTTLKHPPAFNPSSTLPFLPEACCSTTSVPQRPAPQTPALFDQAPNAARFKPATLQKFNLDNYLSSNDSASLPDLARLDGATAGASVPSGFSRQETARLCSQRRQELQRMREEAELLRANPLRSVRYLYHPVVRAWLARWKFPLLVLIMNICLTTMFYKLVTYSKRFTGDDKDDPGGSAANDDDVD